MLGEMIAEVRKDHGDTQVKLAQKLTVAVQTVQAWEQGRSSPDHETLVKICKLYNVSSDYLLGLSKVDPAYVQRRRLEQFTETELREIRKFEEFLIWKKANK